MGKYGTSYIVGLLSEVRNILDDDMPGDLLERIDEALEGCRLGDGSPDAALAIGEHAFIAGFKACADLGPPAGATDADYTSEAYKAWSAYEPSEAVKELT